MHRLALAASPVALAALAWSCGSSSGGATGSGSGDSGPSDSGPSIDGSLAQDSATSSDAAPRSDGPADAHPDASDAAAPYTTAAGCPLPGHGWTLKLSDHFGTGGNVATYSALHAKYYEAQFYDRDAQGLVLIPNVVINNEQETYSHFETAVVFASDHLTIQARGQPDGAITSGEMVSRYTARSLCVEGKYRIPSADKSWPAFWLYGSTSNNDSSEIDVEQPITPNQGVHDVSMYNHPSATTDGGFPGNVTVVDPKFTTTYMTWTDPSFDGSAAPHLYTACYDDTSATITRCIDGKVIYRAAWKWNASLGGTGHGPDACTTVNLAVGGDWPGNVINPSAYTADLDLYSIDYWGP
jgi:hypothetical protein